MDESAFLSILRDGLPDIASRLKRSDAEIPWSGYETPWQVEIANLLAMNKHTTFMEYPVSRDTRDRGRFDFAITENDDCWKPTHLIELKCVFGDTQFIPEKHQPQGASKISRATKVEKRFHSDIQKLREFRWSAAYHWFLVIAWTRDEQIDARLTEVASVLANSTPTVQSRTIDNQLWQLLLWTIDG